MSRDNISRRDFNKLSVAALGGLAVGAAVGCGGGSGTEGDGGGEGGGGGETASVSGPDCWLSGDKNICRGLNVCKGHGQGEHECAGTGTCATNVTAHECGTLNSCACEGGCGEAIGENTCKGEGGCAVPIKSEHMWEQARKKFEAAMKTAGKNYGEAPPAAG